MYAEQVTLGGYTGQLHLGDLESKMYFGVALASVKGHETILLEPKLHCINRPII